MHICESMCMCVMDVYFWYWDFLWMTKVICSCNFQKELNGFGKVEDWCNLSLETAYGYWRPCNGVLVHCTCAWCSFSTCTMHIHIYKNTCIHASTCTLYVVPCMWYTFFVLHAYCRVHVCVCTNQYYIYVSRFEKRVTSCKNWFSTWLLCMIVCFLSFTMHFVWTR